MNVTSFQAVDLNSLRQALGMAVLRKSMNQDASAVNTLLKDMQAVNSKTMEQSITPYKGTQIDIKI
jgi:hypothetical protein